MQNLVAVSLRVRTFVGGPVKLRDAGPAVWDVGRGWSLVTRSYSTCIRTKFRRSWSHSLGVGIPKSLKTLQGPAASGDGDVVLPLKYASHLPPLLQCQIQSL